METELLHSPVLVREVVEFLRPEVGGWFVDCTLGMGGHSEALLQAGGGARVLGLDKDPDALASSRLRLAAFGPRFKALHCDFRDVQRWSAELEEPPAGVLADLGFSRRQLSVGRGLSFQDGSALDMRLDPTSGRPVSDFVNEADPSELARVLREFGEEPHARRIALAIASERTRAPISSARRLAEVIAAAVPARPLRGGRLHPATRAFQALRIFVNRELEGLDLFAWAAARSLRKGGRLAVIAYHSLEDRLVKHALRDMEGRCTCPPALPVCACGRTPLLLPLFRGAAKPGGEETAANPSARSARLRVGERQ